MIFGNVNTFAIDIGEMLTFPGASGIYVQFRFWIGKIPVGDWDDRISLLSSVEDARAAISVTEDDRRLWLFSGKTAAEVFKNVYDDFFKYNYSRKPQLIPNLRDRFHLDGIGMGAIQDKYGVVLVAESESTERVIAKDLRNDYFLADVIVPFGFVESSLRKYIAWGQTRLK